MVCAQPAGVFGPSGLLPALHPLHSRKMLPRTQLSSALKQALPRRSFASSARAFLPRTPATPLTTTPKPARRGVVSSPVVFDPQEPSHAAVREDITIPCVGLFSLLDTCTLLTFLTRPSFTATPSALSPTDKESGCAG